MDSELCFLPIAELARRVACRELSPVEIVSALLDRIDALDRTLRSYITVCRESALDAARLAELDIHAGRSRGPLHGIPIAHKDVFCTAGVRTTCHSKTMLDVVPAHDATHVRRLAEAGMVLLGKTNTPEFAIGTMDVFGTTRNPWDIRYYTGGSSAGSGNAVAAGLAVAATGSDTAGSIRIPSSCCGVAGLKPTYGRVSRYGVYPLAWSLDHVGPMGRTVADCARLLGAMAGHDPLDPTSVRRPVPDYTSGLDGDLRDTVLGVPRQYFFEGLDPEVDLAMQAALRHLETLGARLEPVDLPSAPDISVAGWTQLAVEAYAHHAPRLRRRGRDYGARARQCIAGGAFLSAAEYWQAAGIRTRWTREVNAALDRVHAIVTPTLPFPPYTVEAHEKDPPDNTWGTVPFNASGHPVLSVPCGFTSGRLPIGMQVVGRAFDESTILHIGHVYEQSAGWHTFRPALEMAA